MVVLAAAVMLGVPTPVISAVLGMDETTGLSVSARVLSCWSWLVGCTELLAGGRDRVGVGRLLQLLFLGLL